MRHARFRPSGSMVVAIIALVVAASGTAVAATKLVSGDKLIKKGTLSGNRLRKHTLTGTQINVKKLGKVSSAKNADHATSATTATNATNATNAGNAAELGGQPSSSFLTGASRLGTNGIFKMAGSATGTTETMFTTGPFTIKMTCTKTGAGTTVSLTGQSSEAKSMIDGAFAAAAGTTEPLGFTAINTPSTTPGETNDVNIDFEAPSGAQALLIGADGINSLGADCWGNWAGLR